MKTFKVMCAASVLALSLSVPAYSDETAPGDGHSPGSPAPAPIPVSNMTSTELTAADNETSLVSLSDLYWVLVSIY